MTEAQTATPAPQQPSYSIACAMKMISDARDNILKATGGIDASRAVVAYLNNLGEKESPLPIYTRDFALDNIKVSVSYVESTLEEMWQSLLDVGKASGLEDGWWN